VGISVISWFFCKVDNEVESSIVAVLIPVRLEPGLEDVVNAQVNRTSSVRGISDILEALSKSFSKFQGSSEGAESEEEG
jgi:hypothetical protein